MENLEKIIADHPFFDDLAPGLLKIIASCATEVHYEPEHMIYREGDEANQFLLIRDGRVAIEIFSAGRGSLIIQTEGPGEVLGWSWLFPPYRRRFDTRAIEGTRAIALDGKFLREKTEEDNRLGYELFKRFSRIVVERLQATTLQLLDIYGKHS